MQSKIKRLESPYASNCTHSWGRTPFADLISDFRGFKTDDIEYKSGIAAKYNLAVNEKHGKTNYVEKSGNFTNPYILTNKLKI